MAKILTKNYFVVGDTEYGTWSSPGNMIDGNYTNEVSMRKGGHYSSNHIDYYYKFAIPADAAESMQFVCYPGYHSLYTINIGLYYGNESSRTRIGSVWTQKMSNAITPNKPKNGGNPIQIDFGLTAADRNTIETHKNELMLGMYVTGSYTGYMNEVDIIVPDTSKIYVGGNQASAVYVGGTKASAVYVGTTKVL